MSHRRIEKPSRVLMACEPQEDDGFLAWYFGQPETEGDEIQASAVAEHNSMQIPGED